MSRLTSLLFLTTVFIQAQALRMLDGVHAFRFGMGKPEVAAVFNAMSDSTISETQRDGLKILSVRNAQVSDDSGVDRLRAFIGDEDGLFAVEEEHFLKWDHQRPNGENMEVHRAAMEEVLGRLRGKYGGEDLLEETAYGERYREYDFVTASWQFADHRWIHVIYEPQDWELYPELVKIVIIYIAARLDPRSPQSAVPPRSFNSSKR